MFVESATRRFKDVVTQVRREDKDAHGNAERNSYEAKPNSFGSQIEGSVSNPNTSL